jgi:magnesium chelatase subunit I
MVYEGEQQGPEMVVRKLVGTACAKLAGRKLPEIGREAGSGGEDDTGPWAPILAWFAAGNEVSVTDESAFEEHERELSRVPGLAGLVAALGATREERAFWAELALEALHQAVKVARQDLDSRVSYKELLRFQLLKPPTPRRGPRRSGDAN